MAKAQSDHGSRVEARQRINHQPNNYRPMTEAELQVEKLTELDLARARIAAVMHPDPEIARALTKKLAA